MKHNRLHLVYSSATAIILRSILKECLLNRASVELETFTLHQQRRCAGRRLQLPIIQVINSHKQNLHFIGRLDRTTTIGVSYYLGFMHYCVLFAPAGVLVLPVFGLRGGGKLKMHDKFTCRIDRHKG